MLKKTSIEKIMITILNKSTNIISLDSFRYGLLIKNNQFMIIFNINKINKEPDNSDNFDDFYDVLINGHYNSSKCPNKNLARLFADNKN